MAQYGQLPENFGQLNEAQQNDAVRAAGYMGLSDYKDNANKLAQGNPTQTNAQVGGGYGEITDINKYLDNVGQGLYDAATKIPTREELTAELTPETPKPQATDYVKLIEEQREKYGITGLETQLNDLKGQQDEILATRRQRISGEEGKAVPVGVIAGRVGEVERQEGERLDTTQRAISRLTDQINTAYGAINLTMNATKMTFEEARTVWNDEFNANMEIYKLQMNIRGQALDELKYEQSVASATLQTYVNLIQKGNMTFSDLGVDQQTQLAKLSVQAGFPPDFLSQVKINPKDQMLFVSEDKTQIAFMDANGNIRVDSTGVTPKKSGSGDDLTPTQERNALGDATKALTAKSKDKHVDVNEVAEATRSVMSSTGLDYSTAQTYVLEALADLINNSGYRKYGW